MRRTFRQSRNDHYWRNRWAAVCADDPIENMNVYPIKYAEMAVCSKKQRILEAGCGAGRVVRYYHNRGYQIEGFDFVKEVVDKLKEVDSTLKVKEANILGLDCDDSLYDVVLAFGLYHNFDVSDIKRALSETHRVLKVGGLVCASFRADNIQTKLTDWLTEAKSLKKSGMNYFQKKREFHKMNLKKSEFESFLSEAGFQVTHSMPVVNMPILYKFRTFRANSHKLFDENLGRKEGYQLSKLGTFLQKTAMQIAPEQFCNIHLLIGKKTDQ